MPGALARYEKAIIVKPAFAEAHNNRSVVLRRLRCVDRTVRPKVRPFLGHRHRQGTTPSQGVLGRPTGPGKDTGWSIGVRVKPHRDPSRPSASEPPPHALPRQTSCPASAVDTKDLVRSRTSAISGLRVVPESASAGAGFPAASVAARTVLLRLDRPRPRVRDIEAHRALPRPSGGLR
jgi:hypothetical protein